MLSSVFQFQKHLAQFASAFQVETKVRCLGALRNQLISRETNEQSTVLSQLVCKSLTRWQYYLCCCKQLVRHSDTMCKHYALCNVYLKSVMKHLMYDY